jgi:hypothetical protein
MCVHVCVHVHERESTKSRYNVALEPAGPYSSSGSEYTG